jgi:hypothetical protein
MINSSQFETDIDSFLSQPEITPQIIEGCARESSKWIIASLSQSEQEAVYTSSSTLKDVLKNIVLEADSASYEKYRPELGDALKRRITHGRAIISYCDEVVSLLHLSYTGAHPLKQRIIKDFQSRLASRFAPWTLTKYPSELVDKIPWDAVFKQISELVRDHIVSIIHSEEAEETKLLDGCCNERKDAVSQQLQKRAETLVNLKEKIKRDRENSNNQAHVELTGSDLILLKNSTQETDHSNTDGNSSTNGNN